jgi:hypothetical protein
LNRKQESTVPLWPTTTITDSAMVAIGTKQATTIADSVMMTIGTNYRSGSDIVATTGSGSKADSAMVAIRIINEPQEDSAIVAIRENNKLDNR